MTRLRSVLLGAGKSGRLFSAAMATHPRIEVRAVVAGSRASAVTLAATSGAEAMGSDDDWMCLEPDLVVVATPHELHHRQIEAALSAGASVICDKPLAISAEQWESIAARADSAAGRVFCSFVQRCSPGMLECRDYLRPRASQITAVSIQQVLSRDQAYYRTWKGSLERSGGGVLANQAIHALDLAQFVTGMRFGLEDCLTWIPSWAEVETVVMALLVTDHGTPVTLSATTASALNEQQIIRISIGEELVLLVGSEVVSWASVRSDTTLTGVVADLARGGAEYGPGYHAVIDDAVRCILDAVPSQYELEMQKTDYSHRLIYEIYQRIVDRTRT